jgi:PTH1 family peptidyl-tRNA hydrolase
MRLFVGLGNPGKKYIKTRHNVGHMVIDALQKRQKPKEILAKKTSVYMNDSGAFVKKIVDQYNLNLSDLWVIHDDLDLALGDYKIQKGKGPRLHKGILSIEKELGSDDFIRVRVGVDNRSPENRISGEEYVLQDFTNKELAFINGILPEIVKKILNE